MKKIATSLCLLAALLLFCSSASAESFTGGTATLDVPEGWTRSFKEGSPGELRLMAPDGAFRIAVLMGSASGMTSGQGARMVAKSLKGTEPEPTRNPDVYSFTGQSGVPRCLVMVKGARMVAVMEGGDRRDVQQQIGPMMGSLVSADTDEQDIFDALKPFFQ